MSWLACRGAREGAPERKGMHQRHKEGRGWGASGTRIWLRCTGATTSHQAGVPDEEQQQARGHALDKGGGAGRNAGRRHGDELGEELGPKGWEACR